MSLNLKNRKKHIDLKYVITTIISLCGIIISVITLNMTISQHEHDMTPNIIFTTIDNNYRIVNYKNRLILPNPKKVSTNIKLINIGNGTAQNITYSWDKTNVDKLISLIDKIDYNNIVNINYKYPIMIYNLGLNSGGVTIRNNFYNYYFDYIMSEKNASSETKINFPMEYILYIQILFYLSSYYNYDITNDFHNLSFVGTLTYVNQENQKYKKHIQFKPQIDITENQKYDIYDYKIEPQNI